MPVDSPYERGYNPPALVANLKYLSQSKESFRGRDHVPDCSNVQINSIITMLEMISKFDFTVLARDI